MQTKSLAKDIWALCLMIAIAIANFIVFGLIHDPGWKDAIEYSRYAKNLLLGHGYSLDGVDFNVYREPGVSFYLTPFYKLFGIETPLAFFAANFTQALLLGLLGFIIYRIVKSYGGEWLAVLAGAIVASQPILGDHTNGIGTEAMFTFMIGVVFFLSVRIMREPATTPWYWYALLGLACGWETLVRAQFILFLPFIIGSYALYLGYRRTFPPHTIRNAIITLVVFAAVPGSFATYIYAHTGHFAVTQGRQEILLYYRAVRTELSYGDLTRYLHDWILRSVSGGYNSQFLTDNEFKKLGYEYGLIATTNEAVARIRADNINTIRSRPGQYLYGNLIEMIKLAYIEHDYSDTLSRYFRPPQYLAIYSFFLFGLYQLLRAKNNWDLKTLAVLAMLFLAYNYLSLSFVSVVPRMNTPYLPLYILVGFIGAILARRTYQTQSHVMNAHNILTASITAYLVVLAACYITVFATTHAWVINCRDAHPPAVPCRTEATRIAPTPIDEH